MESERKMPIRKMESRIHYLESRLKQLEQMFALTTGCFGLYVVSIYYVYYSISK